MTIVGDARAKMYASPIQRRAQLYSTVPSETRAEFQLRLLNREWSRILEDVPYFKALVSSGRVPSEFESLAHFATSVKPTSRSLIQSSKRELTSQSKRPDFHRTTGGSTGEPLQLPAWKSENSFTRIDTWWGRSWYGITPASKAFLLWGRSQALDPGARGRLRATRAQIKDRLLGYVRVPAYNISRSSMRKAGDILLGARPDYVIGFSAALHEFLQVNEDRTPELRDIGIRATIGAAENFPSEETPLKLAELFDAPVGMEYGSGETGLVAHTHPTGGYRVFWHSYLVEAAPSTTGRKVLVTSLYPRCFPLVRYEIGDEIDLSSEDDDDVAIERFDRLRGRVNDYVILNGESKIHMATFMDVMRDMSAVSGFQVVQRGSSVTFRLKLFGPMEDHLEREIFTRLGRVHPSLGDISIEVVDRLTQTSTGKTRTVIRESDSA